MTLQFSPFDVSTPHVIYVCLGAFVALFGLGSLFIREKLYVGEPLLAFVFGVIIGPYGVNILNPHEWGGSSVEVTDDITLEFSRIILGIGVFAIGVELPKAYVRTHWKTLVVLLGPVMTWGWIVCASVIYAFAPGLNFLSCLAVASCLISTDPILASAVVGGRWADKNVPSHLRHLLAAESACNDGAAFPYLYLSLYILLYRNSAETVRDWFIILWLYHICVGLFIGISIGVSFRYLMKYCQRRNLIDRQSFVAQYISLAMFTLGASTLMGVDDVLSCFACGASFAWDGFFNQQIEESLFSAVVDLLFNVASFVFVGAWIPFSAFQGALEIGIGKDSVGGDDTGLRVWRLATLSALVFLLRRIPVVVALYRWIPDIKSVREAIFTGHFGPIGIGAIYISTVAVQVIRKDKHSHTEQVNLLEDLIQTIVAFNVLCSVAIHGLSIPSFSLGRRVRTVSRTWSRSYSISAGPEWTNQAKWVDRGSPNIVINQESVMEQGGMQAENIYAEEKQKKPEIREQKRILKKPEIELVPKSFVGASNVVSGAEITSPTLEGRTPKTSNSTEDVRHLPAEYSPTIKTGIERSLHLLDGLQRSLSDQDTSHDATQSSPLSISILNQVKEIDSHMREVLSVSKSSRSERTVDEEILSDEEEGWTDVESRLGVDSCLPNPQVPLPDGTKRRSHLGKANQSPHLHVVHHHHHHHHRGRSSRRNILSMTPTESRAPSGSQTPISTVEPAYAGPSRLPHGQSYPPRLHTSASSESKWSPLTPLNFSRTSSGTHISSLSRLGLQRTSSGTTSSPAYHWSPPTSPLSLSSSPAPPASFLTRKRPNTADGILDTAHLPHSRPSTRPPTADSGSSVRFSNRVGHLKSFHLSREASPVRSIRFMDEATGSGWSDTG